MHYLIWILTVWKLENNYYVLNILKSKYLIPWSEFDRFSVFITLHYHVTTKNAFSIV